MKTEIKGSKLRLLSALVGGLVLAGSGVAAAAETQDDESELLFKKGMEALEDDRLRTAIESFHTILSNQPTLHRARLELAVAYYRAFQYEEARKLAQEVLDDSTTPPEVRVTILAFLGQIKQDQERFAIRHEFKPSVSVGYMYDSNVNVGPSSDIVQIGDQTLTLVPGSTERSDSAGVLSAGLTHRFQPNKTFQFGERTGVLLWQSDLGLYHREYSSEDEFNLSVLSASTGPAWIMLRHWRANIAARADYIWLGNSKLALFTSVNPAITWQFNNGEVTVDASLGDRDYEDNRPTAAGGDGGREGTFASAGSSLGMYFNQRRVAAQIGARALDFQAVEDRFGYEGFEAFAGVNVKAWEGGSVYGRVSFRSVDYDAIEPGFTDNRDEDETRIAVGVNHEFRDGYLDKWNIGASAQYTENDSNISIYDYDRRQVMVNLGKTF